MKKLLLIPFLISLFHINTVHAGCWDMFRTDPVHTAVRKLNVKELKRLIEAKSDLNVFDKKGRTPLHRAAKNEPGLRNDTSFDPRITQLLIDAGVDINIEDKKGRTPLYYASNNPYVTEFLLKHGAKVNVVDSEGSTPLHYAEYREVVRLLIKYGAKINVLNDNREHPITTAGSYGAAAEIVKLKDKDPKDIDATLPKEPRKEDFGLLF